MASSTSGGGYYFFLVVAFFLLSSPAAYGQLSTSFYATSCPALESTVRSNVSSAIAKERRMGASLLRLFFHDCFVQGCDASVLLDNDRTIISEKDAGPNANSLRGFEVIDQIKTSVEKACPNVVSCADILALAAREAVVALNGQTWPLLLGRRDSKTANKSQANSDLPSPSSDLNRLTAAFSAKGFTRRELVALSGAHTIGLAKCTNVDQSQAGRCNVVTADGLMASLDEKTPEKFDSNYYKDLRANRGLLTSDRALRSSTDLDAFVGQYSSNQTFFFTEFGNAMRKMSEMSPLTGANNGEVRANCRRVNQ